MDWDPFLLLAAILGLALMLTSARLMQRAFGWGESWRVRKARRRREASRAALRVGSKRTSKYGAEVIRLRKRPGVRRPAVAGSSTYGAVRSVHRVDQPRNG